MLCAVRWQMSFLFLELVHCESVARVAVAVEMAHIGYHAGSHLQLHVVGICGHVVHAVALVGVLKVHTLHIASRYYLCAQHETEQRDNRGAYHIGTQQTPVADTCRQHGYYLAVVGKFRCEEDDGEKDEEAGEEVGVEGDEVEVVVVDDGIPGSVLLCELGYILVEVEDDGDTDDEHDTEEIRAKELLYYIKVESLHSRRPNCSITLRFHAQKSPATICFLAVRTRSR